MWLLALIVVGLMPAIAFADAVTLRPRSIVQLSHAIPEQFSQGKSRVQQIQAVGEDLWFLVWTDALGKDENGRREAILQTDTEGHFKKWILLTGALGVRNFAVSESGNAQRHCSGS